VRTIDFSKEERALLKQFFLITAKPAMFVANVAEDGFENNPLLDRLKAYADKQNAPVVAICAKLEAELSEMATKTARIPQGAGAGRTRPEPADPRRLQAAGPADLFHGRRKGSARLDHPRGRHRAAGGRRDPHRLREGLHPRPDHRVRRLHPYRGEQGAKDAGKMRAEGKDYVVKDGDVMNFLFSS
jgi:ribosome-binding ATPase